MIDPHDALYPHSEFLVLQLSASDDPRERFEIAKSIACTSDDPHVRAAATFHNLRMICGTVDPDMDQAKLFSVNVASAHLKKLRANPEKNHLINRIFGT